MESGACPGPGSIERFLTSKSKSCSMLGSTILIAFIYTAGIYFCVSAAALLGNRNNKVFMYVNSILFAGSWVMWGRTCTSSRASASCRNAVFDAVYIKMGLILDSYHYAMVRHVRDGQQNRVVEQSRRPQPRAQYTAQLPANLQTRHPIRRKN